MSSEFYMAYFLLACLGVFFALNLLNLLRTTESKGTKETKAYAEVEHPRGFLFALAAFGTLFFFLISMTYPFLVFTGLLSFIEFFPLQLRFQHGIIINMIGILLEALGYFLFLWSVLERGRYATSWAMRENHKLVTGGPYRHIRHPSYLAYFLMFFGLFFILLNLIALIPLIAIPGYIRITNNEEQLLVARFGDEYVEYQKRTGRFLPKIKQQTVSRFDEFF
jgi:protein-S-isoprenylcysteine O-methyltransferase Ste14